MEIGNETGVTTLDRAEATSGGNGEPPSREGRGSPTEAAHGVVPRRSQPSIVDRALAAREAAKGFDDPVGPEAKEQTALLEHDLRADAGMPKETPKETEGAKPKAEKPEESAPAPEPVHLFDLPETGFRLDEEGKTVSLKQALTEAESDEEAAKALRDCL
jgi:hypothetical protein